MSGWLGALGGIGSAIGGWINNNNSIDAQMQMLQMQQQFAAEQAKITRDWQEKMRASNYQTAMTDMKAGGLNPILAGNLGGSSVGAVPPATSGLASVPTQSNVIAQGVSSGVQLLTALTQAENTEANTDKAKAEKGLIEEQTTTQPVTREQINALIKQIGGDTRTEGERRGLTDAEIAQRRAAALASSSAAGASSASAYQSTQAGHLDSDRRAYLQRWGALPGPARGYGSLPPSAQLEADAKVVSEAAGHAWSQVQAHSATALSGVTGLKNDLVESLRRTFNNQAGRARDTQGNVGFATPSPFDTPVQSPRRFQRNTPSSNPMDNYQ